MNRGQWQGGALILLCVGLLLVSATLALSLTMPKWDLEKSAQLIQTYAVSLTVLAGGLFAAVRFELFRNFIPHVTISQVVSHRPISDSYVHLMVTVTLHNSSKVKIDFRECYFQLQKLAPTSDGEVERLYEEVFNSEDPDGPKEFQWNALYKKGHSWRRNELIVEPGETHQETCEFIVTSEVASVLAYTYFYNPRQPHVPEGWGVTTAYDIMAMSK